MSKDKRQTTERLDIARERIAAEQLARTGRLDLSNLGLTRPPPELAELDWLEALRLGGFSKGSLRFLLSKGEWEAAAADNPNRIEPIASWLTGLPHLRSLDCSGHGCNI
ncbi:hypothetical protein [Candidatus Thiosymbion oneisti]|uniref:hypothetical protein n=1 Tax=Candidatus Thiosymbion oneisti TaxID=589554 RepID=UPI000B7D6BF9|nr:hypothetical protein [Candidatus Thiosymbion oneisti]